MDDRTGFFPRHSSLSDNVLPNDPLFLKLLTLANGKYRHKPIIRDVKLKLERNILSLLGDVVCFKKVIKQSLTCQTLQDLDDGKEVFICICAAGGYEFTVAILATLALGASPSLLSVAQPVEELGYYVDKIGSVAIICATEALRSGQTLEAKIRKDSQNHDFVCVPVEFAAEIGPTSPPRNYIISSDREPDPNGTGIVIFTSGTTGYVFSYDPGLFAFNPPV